MGRDGGGRGGMKGSCRLWGGGGIYDGGLGGVGSKKMSPRCVGGWGGIGWKGLKPEGRRQGLLFDRSGGGVGVLGDGRERWWVPRSWWVGGWRDG